MKAIREYVRLVLEEKRRHAEMSEDEDLLVEPDEANEKEIEEKIEEIKKAKRDSCDKNN